MTTPETSPETSPDHARGPVGDPSDPRDATQAGADRRPVIEDLDGAWADEEAADVLPGPGGSRTWWIVGGILIAAAVALAAWIGIANARDDVSYHDVGFVVDSPTQVTARWQIAKPADKPVRCLVRALDERHGVVGAVEVDVPAGVAEAVRTTTIKTTALAVTGTVRTCEIVR